jgi:hypothetical protein
LCELPGADNERERGIITATHIRAFNEAAATEQIGTSDR